MMSPVLCALPGHGDAPEIMNIPFRVLGKSTSTIQGCVSSSFPIVLTRSVALASFHNFKFSQLVVVLISLQASLSRTCRWLLLSAHVAASPSSITAKTDDDSEQRKSQPISTSMSRLPSESYAGASLA